MNNAFTVYMNVKHVHWKQKTFCLLVHMTETLLMLSATSAFPTVKNHCWKASFLKITEHFLTLYCPDLFVNKKKHTMCSSIQTCLEPKWPSKEIRNIDTCCIKHMSVSLLARLQRHTRSCWTRPSDMLHLHTKHIQFLTKPMSECTLRSTSEL